MSSSSSRPLSRINYPRAVLWLASIVIAVLGVVLIAVSNSTQAAIYTAGKADYPKLFAAQSGSTVGGLLIAVGLLGVLLALTSMVITRTPAPTADGAAPYGADVPEFDEEEPAYTPAAERPSDAKAPDVR